MMSTETVPTIPTSKRKQIFERMLASYKEGKHQKKIAKEKRLALMILPLIHISLPEELKEPEGFRTRGKLDLAALISLDESDKEFLEVENGEIGDKEIYISSFGVDDAGRLMFRRGDRHLIYEVNGRGLVVYKVFQGKDRWEGVSEVRESYQSFFKATRMIEPALDQKILKRLNLISRSSTS
ncbi:hypothetical protein M1545_03530 [Patescibacteria group bacterium]|nr:hypothetical protein [Patescibacteria group bacterium]